MKLLEFQKKVNAIKKDGKNPHFKSTYATLTQIISEVKPILSELGLILIQPIKDNKVYSIVMDSSVQKNQENLSYFESFIELPVNLTPQQLGSAITYYRRYTLASLLALEIDDDDANLASVKAPVKAKLTATTLKSMIEAIQQGKGEAVKKRMGDYEIDQSQMSVLNLTFKNHV